MKERLAEKISSQTLQATILKMNMIEKNMENNESYDYSLD